MQFAVPQFTDVENKLIGPLTLRQFLVILATGGVDLFFWSLLQFSIFFFLFATPVTILGLALAFGSFNGRPMLDSVGAFVVYMSRPQTRIFKREEPNVVMKIEKPKPRTSQTSKLEEASESRLKELAYLLDRKVQEEKDLIEKPNNV